MRHRQTSRLSVVRTAALVDLGSGLVAGTSLAASPAAENTPARQGATRDNTTSHAVLVTDDEPGTPLTIRGTVFQPDGETPAAGVRLYVYNTDVRGVYTKEGDDREHSLAGWLVTGDDGSYSVRTIMPGSYPGSRVAAHIHYVIEPASGAVQRATLRFADDPYLSDAAKQRARAAGTFASIRPTEPDGDGLTCRFDIRLENASPAPSSQR